MYGNPLRMKTVVFRREELREIWIEYYNYIRCAVAYIATFIPYVSSIGRLTSGWEDGRRRT